MNIVVDRSAFISMFNIYASSVGASMKPTLSFDKETLLVGLTMSESLGIPWQYSLNLCTGVDLVSVEDTTGLDIHMSIEDRVSFLNLYTRLQALSTETLELGVSNSRLNILTHGPVAVKSTYIRIKAPDDYDVYNKQADVYYMSESPECICFVSRNSSRYWMCATLHEAGSFEELNTIRAYVDRGKALNLKETYIMGKARSARKTASVILTPEVTAQPPSNKPPEVPPLEAPVVETPVVETPPPSRKRRSKEEIRADKVASALSIISDNETDDTSDTILTFCVGVVQRGGYTVERGATLDEDEPLTLEEQLEGVAHDLGCVETQISNMRDYILGVKAGCVDLVSKADLVDVANKLKELL